jgi:phosphomannomutase
MNKVDPTIFKAYDIRGIYPGQINEEVAYALARGYATLLQKESGEKHITVAVGQDMRLSSPSLQKEITRGLLDSGLDVVDIGLVSTPTFYFGVAFYGYDGGIQVSASHNPKEWNGIKMVRKNAVPISGNTGIKDIQEIIANDNFNPLAPIQGKLTNRLTVAAEEAKDQLARVDVPRIKTFKIVIDPANAMGILDIDALFAQLPGELIKINYELDGTFPAHEADPFKSENTKQISEKITETKADFGIAIDGDGDRYFILDEKGQVILPAILRGMMAQIELREYPGAIVAYDIRPGRITRDMIDQLGGQPVVTPVGHSLIKEEMIKTNAIFGGEGSGHYFYQLPYGTFEMPMLMVLKLLKYFSEQDKPVSEIVKPFLKYFHSGEINTKVATREQALAKIEEIKLKYADGNQIYIDGVTVEYPDFWFNLRVSNTEALIRLTVEARAEDLMKQKTEELLAIIRK